MTQHKVNMNQSEQDHHIHNLSTPLSCRLEFSSPTFLLTSQAPVDLTEEQKKAARAKRFGASKACSEN